MDNGKTVDGITVVDVGEFQPAVDGSVIIINLSQCIGKLVLQALGIPWHYPVAGYRIHGV